jgi:hypothetical protein
MVLAADIGMRKSVHVMRVLVVKRIQREAEPQSREA